VAPAAARKGGDAGKRPRKARAGDPLAAYKRLRKPMPPPERVIPDKRKQRLDELAEREAREDPP